MRPPLPLIFLSIERCLLSLGCQNKINTPLIYQVQDKSTHKFVNLRKPNNSREQLPNTPPHQPTNSKNINSQTYHPNNSRYINSSTYRLINSQTQKNRQPINLSAHKLTSSKLINLETHQLKNLKLLFLFYKTALIFAPF